MRQIVLATRARSQIVETLLYTSRKFGPQKQGEYEELIQKALAALAENPSIGRQRQDIHADAWTYHIGRRGRNARHLFLYRIRENVEIARFLYDGMDLGRHLPESW